MNEKIIYLLLYLDFLTPLEPQLSMLLQHPHPFLNCVPRSIEEKLKRTMVTSAVHCQCSVNIIDI